MIGALAALLLSVPVPPQPSPRADLVTKTAAPADGGVLILYVDVRGANSNTCSSPFTDGGSTGPCATPQGALNKVPKMLRQQVTVSIDAGSYPGFIVSGFTVDTGAQQTSGGLLIDGVLATSTVTTGTATGTASAGTAGSGSTWGTLTAPNTWTAGDLVGRFVATSNPTNAPIPIVANDAGTLTVAGTWTVPTASTTYTIQDSAVTITGGTIQSPTPTRVATTNRAAILAMNNVAAWMLDAIVFRNLLIAPAAGSGIEVMDASSYLVTQCQIRPTAGTAEGVRAAGQTDSAIPSLEVTRSDVSLNTLNGGIDISHATVNVKNTLVRNAQSGAYAVTLAGGAGEWASSFGIQFVDMRFLNGFAVINGQVTTPAGLLTFNSNHIACASSSGIGLTVGSTSTVGVGAPASLTTIQNTTVATCGTGVQVVGPAVADVTGLSGTVATTGFAVFLGGVISYAKSGVTSLTAGSNEINLDSGDATGTFAGVTAGHCLVSSTSGNYSRACAR